MRARSRAALRPILALAVLTALVVATTTSATAAASAPLGATLDAGVSERALVQSDSPRNESNIVIHLRPNGNARWSVSTTFTLDKESDRTAFRDVANQFERGDGGVGFDVATFRRANRAANATVDRPMSIRAVERNGTITMGANGTATGRLTLAFVWTNFGRRANGQLHIGSAFNTTDGTWLPGLAADQTLEIRPPRGYGVFTATTRPRAGVLRWEGPTTFSPGDVAAVYERNAGPTPTPTPVTSQSPTVTSMDGETSPPRNTGLPGGLVLISGVGGLLLVGAVLLVLRRRRDDDGGSPGPTSGAGDGGDGDATAAKAGTDDTDTAGEAAGAAAGGVAAGDGSPDGTEEETKTELLSDEERVERLLERNGGRMKQANIVSETGWSNAKVSQLLSAMDEADRIDKLRIGRENLISLPGEDVTELDEE